MEMEPLPVDNVFVTKKGKPCFDCTFSVCMINNKSPTRLNTPGNEEILSVFSRFGSNISNTRDSVSSVIKM